VKYIVAGYHKTGTKSLAKAFRSLGYRVFDAGELMLYMRDVWTDFFEGKATIQDVALEYDAHNVEVLVDHPCMFFWKQFAEIWPKAKVILTMRDNTDVWWRSAKTFFRNMNQWPPIKYGWFLCYLSPTGLKARNRLTIPSLTMIHGTIKMFQNFEDLDNQSVELCMRNRYEAHNANVMHNCLPERLLVFNVKEGWAPLCKFMQIEPIQGLLPHTNKSKNKDDTFDFMEDIVTDFTAICKKEIVTSIVVIFIVLIVLVTVGAIVIKNNFL